MYLNKYSRQWKLLSFLTCELLPGIPFSSFHFLFLFHFHFFIFFFNFFFIFVFVNFLCREVGEAISASKIDPNTSLSMSLLISNDKFVKIGILVPDPSPDTVTTLCALSKNSNMPQVTNFQTSIFTKAPKFVEYLYVSGTSGIGMYANPGIIFSFLFRFVKKYILKKLIIRI
jgi:hypothetical protein